MKHKVMMGLGLATALVLSAFAAQQRHHQKIENSRDNPRVVIIRSGNQAVAELKLIKNGTLNVDADEIVYHSAIGSEQIYNCTGTCKLEFATGGKTVLSLSGDSMVIQGQKASGSPK